MWEEFIVIAGGVIFVASIILGINHCIRFRRKVLQAEIRRRKAEIDFDSGYDLVRKLKEQKERSERIARSPREQPNH